MGVETPANTRLEIGVALLDNENTRPIIDGRVVAEGLRLMPTVGYASEIFWRQLRFADFDASEMSLSSLMIAITRGEQRWVALPIFTMRHFFHTLIQYRDGAGIRTPADLRGKRVGVPEYQQTAAVWSRGALQHEFGVHPREIEWHMERGADRSHGAATGFAAPPGVTVRQIPPHTDIGDMLVRGALDAALHYRGGAFNLVDRGKTDLSRAAQIRPLFPDRETEGRRYYASSGIYPINHAFVVRRSLVERHPWIARSLYDAFTAARQEARRAALAGLQPQLEAGLIDGDFLARDPLQYGVRAARPVIEALAAYSHEQGLIARVVKPEEIFAPELLDT